MRRGALLSTLSVVSRKSDTPKGRKAVAIEPEANQHPARANFLGGREMKIIVRTLVVLLMLTETGIPPRAESPASIVGTWRLVSFDREVVETKAVSHAFGGHALGRLTYTADGHMMVMIVDSTRKPPAKPAATDAEALDLYRTMVAYAGTYHVQGSEIITHVEISWSQDLTGTDQKRFFKLEGNRLTTTTPPMANAFLENQTAVATLVWERME
jgi:hypothetical protein